ncbi:MULTISPECIES: TIGR02677 family protein [unclassified Saccharopolyspora]|uniref:TIGR02677 family protein n=1 Tax=unclassified Saccharopolyspora TaxID=2646250 RepID=UPI001CD62322|nr:MULTISPECIES: TIGR02677 family protein [unclassified Saccharopolyspora]MCA1190371.1 TIGR02677 family protein [Saccharopolyspora sp. 6T]MCA1281901.1 TIGR02677 family protein [Saccharopolyspora sp. 7B]
MATQRVPPDVFRFAVGAQAESYSAILRAFADAAQRWEGSLGIDDVRDRVRASGWLDALGDGDLAERLKKLAEWGLLDVVQHHAEDYRTAAEYERRNLHYALTKAGAAAWSGLRHAMASFDETGALQTAVLDAIADRLAEIAALLAEPGSADRRLCAAVHELEGHLESLRTGTAHFHAELRRLQRSDDPGEFDEVKAATVAHLQEFTTDLDQRRPVISAALAEVEAHGVADLHRRALRGADLPPTADERDWLERRAASWGTLRDWFRPADGSPPRAELLRAAARGIVGELLRELERITEARSGSSSAAADFRELARWFTTADRDEDLHRLWSAAFGLGPARHAHLAHEDPELVAPATPWVRAPRVRVSALLRSGGRVEKFGSTGKVRDVAQLAALRAARARRERAELDAAWQRLVTGGEVRLSSFTGLEPGVLDRLLDLLGRALASRADDAGVRRARTGDGRVEIELSDPADGRTAELRTERGTLRGPDFAVHVRLVADGAVEAGG